MNLAELSPNHLGFDYQSDKERRLRLVFTSLSKLLKLSVVISIIVALARGHGYECGVAAWKLYVTLIVVMSSDIVFFCISQLALRWSPGCWSAVCLIACTIAKWLFRGAIVSCGVIVNLHYFGSDYSCVEGEEGLLVFLLVVLDCFTAMYLFFGCCVVCSCALACTGLTDTVYLGERTGSLQETSSGEER